MKPVTGPSGDNPITDAQIRKLRAGSDLNLQVVIKRALGSDVGSLQGMPPSDDEVARCRTACAVFYNKRFGGADE